MKPATPFQDFFQTELLPHLEQLETRRKIIVRRLTTAGIGIAGGALLLGLGAAALAPTPVVGLVALGIGGIVFFLVYAHMTTGFVAAFKEQIIGRIVRYVDPGLSYHQRQCIPKSVYMGSRIFLTSPDRYRGEDLVRGKVGRTEIQFSEIHSEYRTVTTDSKGRRREQWHTIFRGIFFVADFNKHFQGETVVLPDTAEKLFGRLGQTLQSWNLARRGELVRLEDVAFERRFVVYADDQVEARYLLSPGLMSRIVGFVERTGHEVCLSFVAASVHVAIPHSKNLFEPRLLTPMADMRLAEEYLEDLTLAVSIVEELNLNTRIWSKQ